jgi:MFS family permease
MNVALSVANPKASRIYRIAISTFFFVAGLTFSTWASRIPDIKTKLHLSDAALGTILFALPVGLLTSLPISGWLVSKFGSRKLIISSALLYPLTLVVLALSASTLQLVIALFFFGVWSNLLNIAMNTQAVSVESMYGRSIMASFHGLWSLAGFTGALVGTFFVSSGFSPLIHFIIICAAAGLLVFATYKYTLDEDDSANESQPIFAKPDKRLLILGLIAFCCMLCEGAMADWSGVYFQNVVETSPSYTTIGYLAFTSTMATGRFVGDWLVTKFGVKRMLQLSGVVITTGLLLAVVFPNIIAATTGFLLVGFGVSSVVPIVFAQAGKSTTMPTSVALAAASTIGFLGFLVGPPLIGFIAEATNLRWSFLLIAILGLGTAVLAGKVKT